MIESAALVVILYTIGMMIKNANDIEDKHIPIMLGIISIPLGIMMFWPNISTGITQGILSAGMAVYGNQIYKQINK